MEHSLSNGLIIVFTGDGKGKTSAALGIALRAFGHKMYVSFIQFMKSTGFTGEARAAERLAPELEFTSLGSGFVRCCSDAKPFSLHKKSADDALAVARQRMLSGSWDIVVLDEINTAMSLGLIEVADVLDLLANKPKKLHLVLTGRNAPPAVIEAADMVTEMRNIKHPYEQNIPARKGIDF
jgi:cob(I)alamin adenosyltransferase